MSGDWPHLQEHTPAVPRVKIGGEVVQVQCTRVRAVPEHRVDDIGVLRDTVLYVACEHIGTLAGEPIFHTDHPHHQAKLS